MKQLLCAVSFSLLIVVSGFSQVPVNVGVQILKAEDARRYDAVLEGLIRSPNAAVRERAVLAAGRIGDERAVPMLADLFVKDTNVSVRTMAAFALGEIETVKAGEAILKELKNDAEPSGSSSPVATLSLKSPDLISRLIEAAGKIAAANAKDPISKTLGTAILEMLDGQSRNKFSQDRNIVLLALTAVLRARPEGGANVVAEFLDSSDAHIRADAANTLTRLRAKNANTTLAFMLDADKDSVARANAARALGAAEDKGALDLLLKAATTDPDSRVRVSAIRALGGLKDAKAVDKLIERGNFLLTPMHADPGPLSPGQTGPLKPIKVRLPLNELREIATVLGRILTNTDNGPAIDFLMRFGKTDRYTSAEVLVALADVSPKAVFEIRREDTPCFGIGVMPGCERYSRNFSLALAEFAKLPTDNEFRRKAVSRLEQSLVRMAQSVVPAIDDQTSTIGLLEAYSAFKDAKPELVLPYLTVKNGYAWDPFIRAAAAGILADLPPTKTTVETLQRAFADAIVRDKHDNDAQLAILDALYKLDKKQSVGTLSIALNATDYLVRKKAFELLPDTDLQKDFPGIVTSLEDARLKRKDQVLPYSPAFGTKLGQVLNTDADYRRALRRKNGSIKAVLTTEKGVFTIVFNPEEAPLTVDNWVKLARSGYFNGLEVHRVVPNFVMQDGDPRGDGNGGPGWSIRCEVNMLSYDRGAVGMALSGKDTGGSQWFVTHSPQPHLDGGYTVFGHVDETGMKVVDNIVRGDKVLSVKIIESNLPLGSPRSQRK